MLYVLMVLALLAGCTIPNVPPNILRGAVLDGSVAAGPNHLIAASNVGMSIQVPGQSWPGFDYGPDIVPYFTKSDGRFYYDQPSDVFIGVSVYDATHIGVVVTKPDSQDWRPSPASSFPRPATSFAITGPRSGSDQPKLGIGDTAILVEAGISTAMLYCDKATFLTGSINCSEVDGGHVLWSRWMPVHAVAGTGGAVYAVRVTQDGCSLVLGRGTGPWNAPTWETKLFPLNNCITELPDTPQPAGGAQVVLREDGSTILPVDDATLSTGNIFALIHDASGGVMQERLFAFSGGWANVTEGQLCLMADGDVSLYDGSLAMMNPTTFDVGGVMLATGPGLALSTIGWMYDAGSQSCVLHEIMGGIGALPTIQSFRTMTAARAGDFSMCAPKPGTDWGWCLGQISNQGLVQSVLTQVCRNYVVQPNGIGYCL